MTIRELAYLALRVIAIYIFSLGLIQLGHSINIRLQANAFSGAIDGYRVFFYSVAPFILLTAMSVVIWFQANKMIKFLVDKENAAEEKPNENFECKGLQTLAFSMVGLILFAHSLPQLLQVFPDMLMISNKLLQGPMLYKTYFLIAQRIFECALGFALLVGARGLSNILDKIRGN